MLVQGVAGSGKTSIALHRVAYLLYQNKNSLKAEDVLILSPNKLFSEYIAGVLPELGEENMSQMSFYHQISKRQSRPYDFPNFIIIFTNYAYPNSRRPRCAHAEARSKPPACPPSCRLCG